MAFLTHTIIPQTMTIDFRRYLVCSSGFDGICARFPETAAVPARVRMMWSSVSVNFAPIVQNCNSPCEDLGCTVARGAVLGAQRHKQLQHTVIRNWCNKNFSNWPKIDGVFVDFGFLVFLKVLGEDLWFWSENLVNEKSVMFMQRLSFYMVALIMINQALNQNGNVKQMCNFLQMAKNALSL